MWHTQRGVIRDYLTTPATTRSLLILVCFALLPLTHAMAGIKAGVSVKDITLAGTEFFRREPRIHDPLFARALVLSDGENKVVIVGMDTSPAGAFKARGGEEDRPIQQRQAGKAASKETGNPKAHD